MSSKGFLLKTPRATRSRTSNIQGSPSAPPSSPNLVITSVETVQDQEGDLVEVTSFLDSTSHGQEYMEMEDDKIIIQPLAASSSQELPETPAAAAMEYDDLPPPLVKKEEPRSGKRSVHVSYSDSASEITNMKSKESIIN